MLVTDKMWNGSEPLGFFNLKGQIFIDTELWWGAGLGGGRGLSKKEKGLVDMDNSVVIAGEGDKR